MGSISRGVSFIVEIVVDGFAQGLTARVTWRGGLHDLGYGVMGSLHCIATAFRWAASFYGRMNTSIGANG